nr:ABC transporter ATP-binding protein [Phytoactinopolyspora limicola]
MIDVRSVSVGEGDVVRLRPTSFSVVRGQCLSLTGQNGAGKTTLLSVLAGLVTPSSGTCLVRGMTPDDRNREFRRCLAASIGAPAFARNLTVAEHVEFVSDTWAGFFAPDEPIADDALAGLGIDHLATRYPHELSTGQAQLFALALVLSRPFDVLILDEPEQRLDDERVDLVAEVIDRLLADGRTVIMATHNARLRAHFAGYQIHLEG